MRTLVVDGNVQDQETAARILRAAGHEVDVAKEAKAALALIERQSPEVIVVDAGLLGMTAFLFIKRLREQARSTRAYVVVVSAKPSATELAGAFSVGADDYMRKPLQREELLVRVGALERIQKWAGQVFSGTGGGALDWSAGLDIKKLAAWQSVDHGVANDMAGLVGRSLWPSDPEPTSSEITLAAQVPLTLASEQIEVRLSVGLDAASVRAIAEAVLGDVGAPEEALRDAAREFANTASGAFKRAAGTEGIALTTGLPADLPAKHFGTSNATGRRDFVVISTDRSIRISFELDVVSKALRRVGVAYLVEGMVLARDLANDGGALLVPAGTRLTLTQIERLRRVVPTRSVDVADAA